MPGEYWHWKLIFNCAWRNSDIELSNGYPLSCTMANLPFLNNRSRKVYPLSSLKALKVLKHPRVPTPLGERRLRLSKILFFNFKMITQLYLYAEWFVVCKRWKCFTGKSRKWKLVPNSCNIFNIFARKEFLDDAPFPFSVYAACY